MIKGTKFDEIEEENDRLSDLYIENILSPPQLQMDRIPLNVQ